MHQQTNQCLQFQKYQLHHQTCILSKFHGNSFYTASSETYSESLDSMPLILTLLENELSLQVFCEILPKFEGPLMATFKLWLNLEDAVNIYKMLWKV